MMIMKKMMKIRSGRKKEENERKLNSPNAEV